MTDEPTYEYVAGQGWVPRQEPQEWAVMFWDDWSGGWRNANQPGYYYKDWNRAQERMRDGIRIRPNYRYEIWTSEAEKALGHGLDDW